MIGQVEIRQPWRPPAAPCPADSPPHGWKGLRTFRKPSLPLCWPQVGRDLVRSGQSMHVIDVDRAGRVSLLPCSSWNFHGDAHPDGWLVVACYSGPSSNTTRDLPFCGVVLVKW